MVDVYKNFEVWILVLFKDKYLIYNVFMCYSLFFFDLGEVL